MGALRQNKTLPILQMLTGFSRDANSGRQHCDHLISHLSPLGYGVHVDCCYDAIHTATDS